MVSSDLLHDPNGNCLKLTCWNSNCQETCWFVCLVCQKALGRTAASYHFSSSCKKHVEAYRDAVKRKAVVASKTKRPVSSLALQNAALNSPSGSSAELQESLRTEDACARKKLRFDERDEGDVIDIPILDSASDEASAAPFSTFPPRLVDALGQWAFSAFASIPEATVEQVRQSFEGLEDMDYFFTMEHQSPTGCCGQGIRYSVARAFQHTKFLDAKRIPTIMESLWHYLSFSQHMSMSEKQKKRECKISSAMRSHKEFFHATSVLPYANVQRVYGPTGVHSLWNTLPIPPVKNLQGCSYSSPQDVLRYMMALGISTDSFVVKCSAQQMPGAGKKIYHLSESKFGRETASALQAANPGGNKPILVCYVTTFRDGFNTGHVKRNRNSIVLFTITIAPPDERTNSTYNTFLIALGLKGNKAGWEAVERKFREDMSAVSQKGSVLSVYHGATRKMVDVKMVHFVSMEDKVERADVTYTLSFASDYHRRFGYSIKIEKPKILIEELEEYVAEQKQLDEDLDDTPYRFGWSSQFVDNSKNGGVLPSCYKCRKSRLQKLGLVGRQKSSACKHCVDWDMDLATASKLMFDAPKDYPQTCAEGCPVPVPRGRPVGCAKLQLVKIDFGFLRNALQFAFYNISRTRQEGCWNQKQAFDYLRACGVCKKVQKDLYKAAVDARGQDEDIDYESSTHIGTFEYPAPYIGHLELKQHIEVSMHLLFLGLSSSNMALTDLWLSTNNKAINTFRRNSNVLLKDTKVYQLTWLNVMQFGGQDGKLTTGQWVSENYLGHTRLNKFLHIQMVVMQRDNLIGADNVSRMVVSFTALVARLLTHSGMDDVILEEIKDYMKEFMSTVRELDLQIRGRKIDQKPATTSSDLDLEFPAHVQGKAKKEAENDPWWLKSNYISLFNLLETIQEYGPLINLWDGGGKGEKFIPSIKIHVPKGIRPKEQSYFTNLHKRVYKTRTIKILSGEESEGRNGTFVYSRLFSSESIDIILANNNLDFIDLSNGDDGSCEEADNLSTSDDLGTSDDESSSSEMASSDDEEDEDDVSENEQAEAEFCDWESKMMEKQKTVYVFRNHEKLLEAADELKPIPCIVTICQNSSGMNIYQLYAVCRMPGRSFGWCKMNFKDNEGVSFYGYHCAEMQLDDVDEDTCPQSLHAIQKKAQMAAIAIPLRYVFLHEPLHVDRNKYCVITNWWKERQDDGDFRLPGLDWSLYED